MFPIHFTYTESCALSKLNGSSIKSQLQIFFPHFTLLTIHLFWITIDFWWLQLTLLKAHDSLQVKWIVKKKNLRKYFQFTFSLQFTFSCNSLVHDPAHKDSMHSICTFFNLHIFWSAWISICIFFNLHFKTFFAMHIFRSAIFSIYKNF